jgi:hypothetical protein
MKRIITAVVAMSVVAIFAAAVARAALAAETTAKTDTSAAKADASAAKTDASTKTKAKAKAAAPADRVVVMYFHRTQRCPTCRKMGSYSEEAVKSGFAKLIKRGKVEFHFIDFQDKKNAKIAAGYEVKGPTLIVAKVAKNKVAKFVNLDEMWTKVGDKDEFIAYVQSNVKDALK